MAGAAFAVFLRSKNTKLRNFSLTAITSVFLSGIVEPAIYGLGVKFKTPLIAGCLVLQWVELLWVHLMLLVTPLYLED